MGVEQYKRALQSQVVALNEAQAMAIALADKIRNIDRVIRGITAGLDNLPAVVEIWGEAGDISNELHQVRAHMSKYQAKLKAYAERLGK